MVKVAELVLVANKIKEEKIEMKKKGLKYLSEDEALKKYNL